MSRAKKAPKPKAPKLPTPEEAQNLSERWDAARAAPVAITAGKLDEIIGDNYSRCAYGSAALALNACYHATQDLTVLMHALRDDDAASDPAIELVVWQIACRLEAAAEVAAKGIRVERGHAEQEAGAS